MIVILGEGQIFHHFWRFKKRPNPQTRINTAFLRPRKKNNSSNREERNKMGVIHFTTFLALWKGHL